MAALEIIDAYHVLINKYMPERQYSRKQNHFFHKPWITKSLKISIRTKNRLFKQTKNTNDPRVHEKYKTYRNVLTRTKQKAKNLFYRNLAIRYGNNKSKIWSFILHRKHFVANKNNNNCNNKNCLNQTWYDGWIVFD